MEERKKTKQNTAHTNLSVVTVNVRTEYRLEKRKKKKKKWKNVHFIAAEQNVRTHFKHTKYIYIFS